MTSVDLRNQLEDLSGDKMKSMVADLIKVCENYIKEGWFGIVPAYFSQSAGYLQRGLNSVIYNRDLPLRNAQILALIFGYQAYLTKSGKDLVLEQKIINVLNASGESRKLKILKEELSKSIECAEKDFNSLNQGFLGSFFSSGRVLEEFPTNRMLEKQLKIEEVKELQLK